MSEMMRVTVVVDVPVQEIDDYKWVGERIAWLFDGPARVESIQWHADSGN